jgi:hypothetical protein
MNTYTYTVSGGNQENFGGSPLATASLSTFSASLTGTTNVTFSLSGLSSYDSHATRKINKIVVDFEKDGSDELIINRPIVTTSIPPISTNTFTHVLETEPIDNTIKNVYLTLYRDDLKIDIIDIGFKMSQPGLESFEDINLINTDYFNTNNSTDEKLLLTFINKNPEVLGLNLIDIDAIAKSEFDPALTYSQTISSESFNIGFTTEYVQVDANESNTGDAIVVQLKNIYLPNTNKKPKNNDNITIRYRTRAANPDIGNIYIPGQSLAKGDTTYIPLTANSAFMHLTGYLNWNGGDLIKDVNLSKKTISIPLIDITGTRASLADSSYFYYTNVGTGVSVSQIPLGGYFMVDLYEPKSCNTITTGISTITAFVDY